MTKISVEDVENKFKMLAELLHRLEAQGFTFLEESEKDYHLLLDDGFIPHGKSSLSWSYWIDAETTYIFEKGGKRFALIKGRLSYHDNLDYDHRFPSSFSALLLLKMLEWQNKVYYPWEEPRAPIPREGYLKPAERIRGIYRIDSGKLEELKKVGALEPSKGRGESS
jgi:hypothetical protein